MGGHLIVREHHLNCEKRRDTKEVNNKDVRDTFLSFTETAFISPFSCTYQKQNRAHVRREKKSPYVEMTLSSLSLLLLPLHPWTILCRLIPKSVHHKSNTRPSLTGLPPGWGCGIRGSGSPAEAGSTVIARQVCLKLVDKDLSPACTSWTHREKKKQMFLLSNRQA